MKKLLCFLVLSLSVAFILDAGAAPPPPASASPSPTARAATPAKPKPVRTPRFVKPPSPVIRVTNVVINKVRMWQVEVVQGSLELTNYTRLKPGDSMPLTDRDIVWKIGQIVEIASDDVWAGGKSWKAGTRLFVDEKGKFLPITGRPRGTAPK